MSTMKSDSEALILNAVAINDDFWTPYIRLIREVALPYQWNVLNDIAEDAEPSHAIRNMKIAAGLEQGDFYGFFFQDTDLAKWLEAVAYSLQTKPNAELERLADEVIDLIGLTQQPDGYINSYFTTKDPSKRWTNLEECHELYTAGHLIEAAVAYHQATGKKRLLDIMCRFADYIDSVFGPEPDKIRGYDGHQEIELALVRLYRETGNKKYMKLAGYFIDERGKDPFFFEEEWEKRNKISYWSFQQSGNPQSRREYTQSHVPVRQQKAAVGHAVRLVYMLTGMADVSKESGDTELLQACRTLWENIVQRQMYITGGIGSCADGEAFTFDYDLPNDTAYAETCASIGLIVFANKMLQIENNRCYSDVIEKELFNLIIGSMSNDGRHYFYANPLEAWPEASEKNPVRKHVKTVRQEWFGCACCPPNLARLIMSLGQYIFTKSRDTIYIHQFISSKTEFNLEDTTVTIEQTSGYPWKGDIRIHLHTDQEALLNVAVRIPGWCKKAKLTIDGRDIVLVDVVKDGYAFIRQKFCGDHILELDLDMPVVLMQANPKVVANIGKVAIQRGPIVYCFEETDNGGDLFSMSVKEDTCFDVQPDSGFQSGAVSIYMDGYSSKVSAKWSQELYMPYETEKEPAKLKAVPYCLWGNREPGKMTVWIRAEK